jgi:type IV pilus assembly protein PilZ
VKEHREHARATLDLRVEYKRLNSFFADYSRDISKGGLFVRTKKPLAVGTRFRFTLAVPSRAEPFSLAGEVVRVQPHGEDAGMGIHFEWGDEEQRADFERAVEALMSESLGPSVAAELIARARGNQA